MQTPNNVLYLRLSGAVSTFTKLTSSSELSLRKLPAQVRSVSDANYTFTSSSPSQNSSLSYSVTADVPQNVNRQPRAARGAVVKAKLRAELEVPIASPIHIAMDRIATLDAARGAKSDHDVDLSPYTNVVTTRSDESK